MRAHRRAGPLGRHVVSEEESGNTQEPTGDEPEVSPPTGAAPPPGEPGAAPPPGKQGPKPVSGKQGPKPVSGKQKGKPSPGKQAKPATGSGAGATVPPATPEDAGASPARAAARERKAREIERRRAAAVTAAKAKRRKQTARIVSAALVVVLIILVVVITHKSQPFVNPKVKTVPISTVGMVTPTVGPAGPEVAPLAPGPILAPPGATGATVDGIQCQTNEQVVYHIHAHLAIFVDGASRSVPYGIGIPHPVLSQTSPFVTGGSCFYWIHTHAADGIIHIESPTKTIYSLGDFFDIWGIPLSSTQVGPAEGPVTVFYNGRRFTGTDPRTLPLTAHAEIQLDVGKPLVAPETIDFGHL